MLHVCVERPCSDAYSRTSRLGRYILRNVDEALWTVAGTVLDAAVGPGVFGRCDICSEFAYFCWYALSCSVLDTMIMNAGISNALSHCIFRVRCACSFVESHAEGVSRTCPQVTVCSQSALTCSKIL